MSPLRGGTTLKYYSSWRDTESDSESPHSALYGGECCSSLSWQAFRTLHRPRLVTALLVEVSLELLVPWCNSSFTIIEGERNVVEFVPKSFSIVSYLPTFLLRKNIVNKNIYICMDQIAQRTLANIKNVQREVLIPSDRLRSTHSHAH